MYDVAIIGAGVIGSLIARELTKYSLSVVVIEKEADAALGATGANSGIVHAGFDAKAGSLKARFNVRGSELMPNVAEELGVKYKKNGSLVIGFNEEDKKEIENLYKRGCTNGVRNLQILDKKAVHELEPNLSENVEYALYAPTGAIICPYELTIAAIGNAMDNGVELRRNFAVSAICKENDVFTVTAADADFCFW